MFSDAALVLASMLEQKFIALDLRDRYAKEASQWYRNNINNQPYMLAPGVTFAPSRKCKYCGVTSRAARCKSCGAPQE